MAKFNTKAVSNVKTENRCGFPAYKQGDEARLVSAVLTSFFGEPKFYGSTDNEIMTLAGTIIEKNPKFIARLAAYARHEFHLRSVSHVLIAMLANSVNGKVYIRKLIPAISMRPDDLTEIMSAYIALFGKPIPNSLKKGIGDSLKEINEYGLAKYSGNKNSMKMKDLIKICHPKPVDEKQSYMWNRCLCDELKTPDTWETALSANDGIDKKTKWERLIEEKRLGFMALLRNLRNIIIAGVSDEHLNTVYAKLSDKKEVLASKQFPYHFLSAYKELQGMGSSKLFDTLEDAVCHSVENLEKLPGTTTFLVDVSGSMTCTVSRKSKMTCAEIALLTAIMGARICDNGYFYTFDTSVYPQSVSSRGGILPQMRNMRVAGGGTNVSLAFKYLLDNKIKSDRIILLSDNEANRGCVTAQSLINKYRQTINDKVFIHSIDLCGYGTVQTNPNDKYNNYIAGWSDKVLSFITLFEKGMDNLVDCVKDYDYLAYKDN
jgi:hypothetical protein